MQMGDALYGVWAIHNKSTATATATDDRLVEKCSFALGVRGLPAVWAACRTSGKTAPLSGWWGFSQSLSYVHTSLVFLWVLQVTCSVRHRSCIYFLNLQTVRLGTASSAFCGGKL